MVVFEFNQLRNFTKIEVPTSKSIYNRFLILRHLYFPEIEIGNKPDSNDSIVMKRLLKSSVFEIELNAEDAGTVFRFMTALLSVVPSDCVLTGTKRMKDRPIAGLVEMLRQCGAGINYIAKEGFPPLQIKGKQLEGGFILEPENVQSSQFYSALAMVAPCFEKGLTLKLPKNLGSKPYFDMTLDCMDLLGIKYEKLNENEFKFYHFQRNESIETISVERDWSSASYFIFLPLIFNEIKVLIKRLSLESIQGDADFIKNISPKLGLKLTQTEEGVLVEYADSIKNVKEIDFSNSPDLSLNFVCIMALKKRKISLTGLESLAIKESDRTSALEHELNKVGVNFFKENNKWILNPNNLNIPDNIEFDSYDDHRVAMALSYFAFFSKIKIPNSDCVSKSYPNFWEELHRNQL